MSILQAILVVLSNVTKENSLALTVVTVVVQPAEI